MEELSFDRLREVLTVSVNFEESPDRVQLPPVFFGVVGIDRRLGVPDLTAVHAHPIATRNLPFLVADDHAGQLPPEDSHPALEILEGSGILTELSANGVASLCVDRHGHAFTSSRVRI